MPGCDGGAAGRANGAEVQNVFTPFAHRGQFPRLSQDIRGGLAGRGGGQVAATFDGGLEGELPIGAVVLVLVLCISHILKG